MVMIATLAGLPRGGNRPLPGGRTALIAGKGCINGGERDEQPDEGDRPHPNWTDQRLNRVLCCSHHHSLHGALEGGDQRLPIRRKRRADLERKRDDRTMIGTTRIHMDAPAPRWFMVRDRLVLRIRGAGVLSRGPRTARKGGSCRQCRFKRLEQVVDLGRGVHGTDRKAEVERCRGRWGNR
jgi:hypothetical protein